MRDRKAYDTRAEHLEPTSDSSTKYVMEAVAGSNR
jgi:hypothetical protein